jgi:hypothetical protein
MGHSVLRITALLVTLASCSTRLDPTLPGLVTDAGAEPSPATVDSCSTVQTSTSQYWICAAVASFDDAAADCRKRGSALATISSVEENAFLAAAANYLGTQTNLWIGGSSDAERVWRWPGGDVFWTGLSTGASPGGLYANWKAGEPNDSSTVVDEPERCAALTLFDSQWNDRACSLALSYFCERSVDGL